MQDKETPDAGVKEKHVAELREAARRRELREAARRSPSGEAILDECLSVAQLLIEKNAAYGDSALNPVRIFSSASAEEQILVRIDDKLSRLSRGHASDEDVVLDLLGYLVLLRVSRRSSQ